MIGQHKFKILLSLGLFIFIYLYVNIYQTSPAVKYLIIGVSLGGLAFILFNEKISNPSKGVLVSLILLLIIVLPFFQGKKPMHTQENHLPDGVWLTDSSGGYSIQIRIQEDSAFLSQSNKSIETGYGLHVSKDSILLYNIKQTKNTFGVTKLLIALTFCL